MFRIGEFSRLTQVTVKALRLYDERGLLVPARVDPSSSYRFYSAAQLPRLQRILALRDLGLTLQEIGDLLDEEPGPDELRGMLRLRRAELERELTEGRARLGRVEAYLARLEREGDMPRYDVTIKSAPALRVATLRDTVPHYPDIGRLFDELCGFLGASRLQFTGPPLALYHDGEYREQDVDIEVAAPFAGRLPAHPRVRERELPAEPALACTVHQGPYEELRHAYSALLGWIEANGYRIAGPDREVYLVGPERGRGGGGEGGGWGGRGGGVGGGGGGGGGAGGGGGGPASGAVTRFSHQEPSRRAAVHRFVEAPLRVWQSIHDVNDFDSRDE